MDQKSNFKLFLALPTYGGMISSYTCNSLLKLIHLLAMSNIPYETRIISNESLIQRARNTLANTFLLTDCTHLFFIDSDIEFNPEDVLRMVHSNVDIIGGIYPAKEIRWDKMKLAMEMYPQITPLECSHIAARMVFNADFNGEIKLSDPLEINEIGTGFLLIHKRVFEKLAQINPANKYEKINPITNEKQDHYAFFNVRVENNRLISEDYAFCQDARAVGFKVHAAPWVHLGHVGNHKFECSLASTVKILGNI